MKREFSYELYMNRTHWLGRIFSVMVTWPGLLRRDTAGSVNTAEPPLLLPSR